MPPQPRGRLLPVFTAAAGLAAGLLIGLGYHATHPSVRLDGQGFGGPGKFTATVARVIDGDTVVLENGLHLRYRNMDTPELIEVRDALEPHAMEARELNRSLVEGRRVVIEPGPEATDRYGRLLGSIILPDGTRVEDIIVRRGLARSVPYNPDDPHLQEIARSEAAARSEGLGIWAREDAPPERRFVAGSGSQIYHLHSCAHARRIAEENRVYYTTEEEAAASGRKPCRHCLGGR